MLLRWQISKWQYDLRLVRNYHLQSQWKYCKKYDYLTLVLNQTHLVFLSSFSAALQHLLITLFCQTFCWCNSNTASAITPGNIVILINCAAALCDIMFNQTSIVDLYLFLRLFNLLFRSLLLTLSRCTELLIEYITIFIFIFKKVYSFLGFGIPLSSCRRREKKHSGLRGGDPI